MAFLRIYSFFYIYISFVLSVYAKDVCTKTSSCICIFPNGTGIDLTPVVAPTFYTADKFSSETNDTKFELSTYFYHPCYDVKFNASVSESSNSCTDPLSICRHVKTMKRVNESNTYVLDSGSYDFMGKSSIAKFSDQGDSIIYPNGPSETIVLLQCAETENQLQVYSLSEPNRIVLAFFSRDACLKQIEDVGRSFGSTLLIVFFSFLIFYLVLGICTKKFLMGATGIEVIPNLGFWTELPNLVKDGWLFMSNGFKLPARASGQTVSPDPNSYDSI